MGKPKVLKLSSDLDVRDVVALWILYLESKKNYFVKVTEINNGFSLCCKTRGLLKVIIALSFKCNISLVQDGDRIRVLFSKYNWIYKTVVFVLGIICCCDYRTEYLGSFLIIVSLWGLFLLWWNKIIIYYCLKKCIKKKNNILNKNIISCFASYLKTIELYNSLPECEQKLQPVRQTHIGEEAPEIVDKHTVVVPANASWQTKKSRKIFNKNIISRGAIKKILQLLIAAMLIMALWRIYSEFRQELKNVPVVFEAEQIKNDDNTQQTN